jgi:hypothetical protein
VKLDHPGAVRFGENITFRPHMSKLILLELHGMLEKIKIRVNAQYHFRLDQRLESVDLAVRLLLDEPDLTECAFPDDPDGGVVLRALLGP